MTQRALILEVVVRGLYPVMLVLSIAILFRGHNAPGGGFIAGLIAVAATSLQAVAHGSTSALTRLPLGPMRLAAVSSLVSVASGLPAALLGLPYMTHLWLMVPFGFAELPLSTVMLFDLGVYGTVWGTLGGLAAAIVGIDEGCE